MESPFRELRSRLGLTQPQIASIAGVRQSHISEVENGLSPLGEKLEAFLKEISEDVMMLKERHRQFMEEKSKEIREGLLAKITESQDGESEGG